MRTTDLRIGNMVYFNGNHKHIGIVTSVQPKNIVQCCKYVEYSNDIKIGLNNRFDILYDVEKIKPIPLTEEILLKCPEYSIRLISKYKRIITFSNLKSDVCVFQQDSKVIRLFCDFRKNTFYIKYGTQKIYFKYLHQLQNLYHALTGEELTVNL